MEGPAARDPLHARVAGLLERAFNPIMVKEVRASLRGSRFFIAHLVILSLFAAGLLIIFAVMMSTSGRYYTDNYGQGFPGDPARVGRQVYMITQLIHLGVVFVVVPGLAASALTSEREALTYELLLSTTLTARQIVWGKFTAAMTQTFTIFVSMIPLVGLCFLFGGITVYQILANYVFLFGLSALMVMFALSISASSRTTQRAVGSVYGMALLMGFFMVGAGIVAVEGREAFPRAMAMAYGFLSPGPEGGFGEVGAFQRVMYVHVIPGFAWAALFAIFFLNAVNRLKPLYANRSTALRVYYAVVATAAAALAIVTIYMEGPAGTMDVDSRRVLVIVYTISLLTTVLLSALFACEDPILPPALAAEVAALRGFRRALQFLWPGSRSGSVFCLLVNGLLIALSFAAFLPYTDGFNDGAWVRLHRIFPLALAFITVLLWAYFCTMLARWLATVLAGRPVLLRSILIITCLFLVIFPIVHWAISHAIDPDPLDPGRRHGPATLGLSPVAAILSALDLEPRHRTFPLLAMGIPIPGLFAFFALAGGTAFLVLAERAHARLRAQSLGAPGA